MARIERYFPSPEDICRDENIQRKFFLCFLWNLNWATQVPNLLQMTLQSKSSSQSSYVKGTISLRKNIQKQLQSRILCVGTTGPCHCLFFSGVMAGLSFTYRNRKWRLMKLSQKKPQLVWQVKRNGKTELQVEHEKKGMLDGFLSRGCLHISIEIYVYLWTNTSGMRVLAVSCSWERKNITPAAEDKV